MVVRGRVQKKALIWFIATCSCILNHGQCQLQRQRLLLSACCLSPNCCLRIYSLDQSLGYLGLASANNGQHYVVMLQESAIQIVTNCYANLFPRLGHCLVKQWLKHRLSKWRPIWAYSICAHIYSVSTFNCPASLSISPWLTFNLGIRPNSIFVCEERNSHTTSFPAFWYSLIAASFSLFSCAISKIPRFFFGSVETTKCCCIWSEKIGRDNNKQEADKIVVFTFHTFLLVVFAVVFVILARPQTIVVAIVVSSFRLRSHSWACNCLGDPGLIWFLLTQSAGQQLLIPYDFFTYFGQDWIVCLHLIHFITVE